MKILKATKLKTTPNIIEVFKSLLSRHDFEKEFGRLYKLKREENILCHKIY